MRLNKRFTNYIDQKNAWGKIFGKEGITFPLTQEDVNSLAENLSSDFSPENLHCDGEISAKQARVKYNKLKGVMLDLHKYCAKFNLILKDIEY